MKLFTHYNQPYGVIKMRVEQLTHNPSGTYNLVGTVVEGGERSRLLWATSTRDLAGKQHRVYGVTRRELLEGHKTTVAM